MKIVQITDCHLYAKSDKSGYNNILPFDSLQQVMQAAKIESPDLILFTGDISGDASQESYHHFIKLCEQELRGHDWYYIPGNHDNPELLKCLLPQQDLSKRMPIEKGNWCVHGLNSQFEKTLGRVDEASLCEMLERIDKAGNKHHVVAVHHHPIMVNGWMDKHELLNRGDFIQQISMRNNVIMVVYGHIHTERRHQAGNTTYMSSPSSCWQWRCSEEFGWTDESPGYRLITLGDEGQFQTQVKRI